KPRASSSTFASGSRSLSSAGSKRWISPMAGNGALSDSTGNSSMARLAVANASEAAKRAGRFIGWDLRVDAKRPRGYRRGGPELAHSGRFHIRARRPTRLGARGQHGRRVQRLALTVAMKTPRLLPLLIASTAAVTALAAEPQLTKLWES